MTAKELITGATDLLGYSTANGNTGIQSRVMNRAVSIVNVVYGDLWRTQSDGEFIPIATLSDRIELGSRAMECAVYGVAAFTAQSENDGDSGQLWMTMYNKKRAGLSGTYRREDRLPKGREL